VASGGERIPRLYTRSGDRGTTALNGGARVGKESARTRAYGTYDELGAFLGWAASLLPANLSAVRSVVVRLQHELFVAQTEIATAPGGPGPKYRIEPRHVRRLETEIDRFDARHPPTKGFVIPGGSAGAAALHICRTVARRAERQLLELHREEPASPELLAWANRLSDLLFALSLAVNHASGVGEVPPDYSV
jgi:cob(I)alamin adenosyltransferase